MYVISPSTVTISHLLSAVSRVEYKRDEIHSFAGCSTHSKHCCVRHTAGSLPTLCGESGSLALTHFNTTLEECKKTFVSTS